MCHGFTSHIPLCVQWSWISTHTDSCHIGVTSHIHLSSDTCVTDSHYTYRSVKDSFTHVSLLNYMCDVTHMWHESATHVTWLNYVYCGILSHCTQRCACGMNSLHMWVTQLCVWRDSCVSVTHVTWLKYMCDMCDVNPLRMWRDSCVSVTHVTWLMRVRQTWDLTQLCGWRDSCVTWIHHTCDMTHVYPPLMWHDSTICVTWLMCDENP